MKTFKNKNFIKRDYETSNCVFIQSIDRPTILKTKDWEECNKSEIETMKCTQLYKHTDTYGTLIYFGYL